MTSKSTESTKRGVGKFSTEPEAKEAQKALQAAGFAPEQISIEIREIDPKPSIKDSQARKSAIGAAIAGAVLGSGFAVLVSLGAANSTAIGPDVSSHSSTFTVLLAIAGGLVGALGFSLMGALSGGAAPKESAQADSETLSDNYLVVVRGTEAEVVRATEIMSQQGAKV